MTADLYLRLRLIVTAFVVTGCAYLDYPIEVVDGSYFETQRIHEIQEGITTLSETLTILGEPFESFDHGDSHDIQYFVIFVDKYRDLLRRTHTRRIVHRLYLSFESSELTKKKYQRDVLP